jgi:hypothetical protein
MTTQSLTDRQACWWEMLSGYNLNKVYRASKKNHGNAPNHWRDYKKAPVGLEWAPEGLCAATVLTARCST